MPFVTSSDALNKSFNMVGDYQLVHPGSQWSPPGCSQQVPSHQTVKAAQDMERCSSKPKDDQCVLTRGCDRFPMGCFSSVSISWLWIQAAAKQLQR